MRKQRDLMGVGLEKMKILTLEERVRQMMIIVRKMQRTTRTEMEKEMKKGMITEIKRTGVGTVLEKTEESKRERIAKKRTEAVGGRGAQDEIQGTKGSPGRITTRGGGTKKEGRIIATVAKSPAITGGGIVTAMKMTLKLSKRRMRAQEKANNTPANQSRKEPQVAKMMEKGAKSKGSPRILLWKRMMLVWIVGNKG